MQVVVTAATGTSPRLEAEFLPLFSAGAGHLPLPIRLACGLLIVQKMFNLSDERIVGAWEENPYWQVFCGYENPREVYPNTRLYRESISPK